jgi:hypothetical protein
VGFLGKFFVIKGMQMEVEMETYDYWEKRIENKN